MGGKSDTPDFGDVAAMDEGASRQLLLDQLFANRPTQYTPFGYTNWEQSPYTDPTTGETTQRWTQTSGLTPELQDILNKQIAVQGGRTDIAGLLTGRMGAEFGAPMDWRGLNPMGQVPTAQFTVPEPSAGNPYETRQRAEDAMYQSAMSRIQPQQASENQALEIKLRNQGLSPGDAAYDSQMQALGQKHTDQNQQAIWGATGEGRQEAGQMYGQLMGRQAQDFGQALQSNNQNWQQALGQSQYANQIRQQQITEQMQKRGFSLNEINALLSGQQVGMPSMPSFVPAAQQNPTDYMGAAAQQGSLDAANNPWSSILNAGVTLGSAALISDRRLKRNIKRIGTSPKGYPWYSFEYVWGVPSEGVMADEVPEEITIDIGHGYKAVDYARV